MATIDCTNISIVWLPAKVIRNETLRGKVHKDAAEKRVGVVTPS